MKSANEKTAKNSIADTGAESGRLILLSQKEQSKDQLASPVLASNKLGSKKSATHRGKIWRNRDENDGTDHLL